MLQKYYSIFPFYYVSLSNRAVFGFPPSGENGIRILAKLANKLHHIQYLGRSFSCAWISMRNLVSNANQMINHVYNGRVIASQIGS